MRKRRLLNFPLLHYDSLHDPGRYYFASALRFIRADFGYRRERINLVNYDIYGSLIRRESGSYDDNREAVRAK